MAFNSFDVVLSSNDWFACPVEYEGMGRAVFGDPRGTIEGPVRVKFSESGESNIEMQIEKVKCDLPGLPEDIQLMALLHGTKPVRDGGRVSLGFGGPIRPVAEFTVAGSKGVWSATESVYPTTSEGVSVGFRAFRSQFDTSEHERPLYWVLPLSNFISEFRQRDSRLDHHPLRIYPTPSIPDSLGGKERATAEHNINRKNRLIIFEFNGQLGFIEPLPDYDDRKTSLQTGQVRNTVTALMVGEVGSSPIDWNSFEKWFPSDLLYFLGLATGTEVGSPWIEFRDAQGRLVRRLHTVLEHPIFSTGVSAIREEIHGGIGHLMTKASASSDWNHSYLRVAVKHIVRGGLYSLSIEDRLSYLFRALDGICIERGLTKNLTPEETLSPKNRELLRSGIRSLIRDIGRTASETERVGKRDEARVLRRIANQLSEAMNIHQGFGKSVLALLDEFSLPDASIVEGHYAAQPRQDGRKWEAVLSSYRGVTMHRGYFDFRSGGHDIDDVITVMDHLHDILIRIIFKMVSYEGTYQPTTIKGTASEPIDWVKPGTPARLLGYGSKFA